MVVIILLESRGNTVYLRLGSRRLRALYELSDAVAHHEGIGIERMGLETAFLKRIVAACTQVVDCIEQSAVEIEKYEFLHC